MSLIPTEAKSENCHPSSVNQTSCCQMKESNEETDQCGITKSYLCAKVPLPETQPRLPNCRDQSPVRDIIDRPKVHANLTGNSSLSAGRRKKRRYAETCLNGNYLAYYGYGNECRTEDPRLHLFSHELLQGKDVLDIGCNAGILTLSLARRFLPRRIVGIDVDLRLVNSAKQNIRHFIHKVSLECSSDDKSKLISEMEKNDVSNPPGTFPQNVMFQVVS